MMFTVINNKELLKLLNKHNIPSDDFDRIDLFFYNLAENGSNLAECEAISNGYTNCSYVLTDIETGFRFKLTLPKDKSYLNNEGVELLYSTRSRMLDKKPITDFFEIYYFHNGILLGKFFDGHTLEKFDNTVYKNISLHKSVIDEIGKLHLADPGQNSHNGAQFIADLFLDSIKSAGMLEESTAEEIKNIYNFIVEFEHTKPKTDFVCSHFDTSLENIVYNGESKTVKLIDCDYVGLGYKYYDYASYYSAVAHQNPNDENTLLLIYDYIHRIFIEDNNFERNFKVSVWTVDFLFWGLWECLYGLVTNNDEYISIGINTIKNIREEMDK